MIVIIIVVISTIFKVPSDSSDVLFRKKVSAKESIWKEFCENVICSLFSALAFIMAPFVYITMQDVDSSVVVKLFNFLCLILTLSPIIRVVFSG